jgi:hypothetical protein
MMSEFKAGFMVVIHCLYPDNVDNWWNQIGRIFGAIMIVGIWRLIGQGFIWVGSWVVS